MTNTTNNTTNLQVRLQLQLKNTTNQTWTTLHYKLMIDLQV